jgi:hypothetical protein
MDALSDALFEKRIWYRDDMTVDTVEDNMRQR